MASLSGRPPPHIATCRQYPTGIHSCCMMSLSVWLPSPMFLLGGLYLWSHVPSGGLCSRGLCPGGFCPRGSHPHTVKSGRYASYLNAFLFCKCFAENCMKIKEFGPIGASLTPRLDPWMRMGILISHKGSQLP